MSKQKSNIGRGQRRRKQKGEGKNAAHVARKRELEAERAAAAMVEMTFGSPALMSVEEPVTEPVTEPARPRRVREGPHVPRDGRNVVA